ncbi:hypothetical protein [Cytobacillus sp. IB215665]|uniref:hypothetical protein n=1 Tax=Cytobacillus sp. IB215665 TaxID=3097357 RepID=UPI002A179CD8|nr:hypothetical protein [Cytobacillus sp. IB215665]MDX8364003.1 hypothetical protein [Cytobacillus sp. IB215665]
MKKVLFFWVTLIFIFNSLLTTQVFAYSYGDPNKEPIAEAYKDMLIKLNEEPPNFSEAKAIYETVKEDVDLHMGSEPTETIIKHIEDENKDAVIKDLEKILVLNIARRLESIELNFEDFDTSKRLLAKGFATYEAISPLIESKDQELDQSLRNEFDLALSALGNPGLFGVGEKEEDINSFIESKEIILSTIQEQLNVSNIEVGHFNEEDIESTLTDTGKKEWTDLSNFTNWIPILLIIGVIIAIVIYSMKKKRK